MKKINIGVKRDIGRLKKVVIGYGKNFHSCTPEIVNKKQEQYYLGVEKPTIETLIPQLHKFKLALESFGVDVYEQEPVQVPDQLTPRDIGFVVGNKFVVCGMAKDSRKKEWLGIKHILDKVDSKNVIFVPKGIILEGGDVIVEHPHIYVGISQRTGMNGVEFLCRNFPRLGDSSSKIKTFGRRRRCVAS